VDMELLDREMWSLSKDEADAVKKRVDTLNATLKKCRQQRADVREVFARPIQVGHSAVIIIIIIQRVCFVMENSVISVSKKVSFRC